MGVLQIILSEIEWTFWSLSSSESSIQLHAFSDMNSTVGGKQKAKATSKIKSDSIRIRHIRELVLYKSNQIP